MNRESAVLVTGQGELDMGRGKWRQAWRERRERRQRRKAFQQRALIDQEAVPQRLAKLLLFGRQVIFLPHEETPEGQKPVEEGS